MRCGSAHSFRSRPSLRSCCFALDRQHRRRFRREDKIRKFGGRSLIAVMCIGQVGNLLPHVTLSANLAQHLMPAWGLSAAEGGLMASGYAFGYMLAVPVLTTL